MSKVDYLTEDTINPNNQIYVCVSFFSKHYVKQSIENLNDYRKEDEKEEYSTDDDVLDLEVLIKHIKKHVTMQNN